MGGEGRGWSPIRTDRLVPLEAAESAPSVWWSVTRSSSLLPSNAKPGRELACPLPPSLSHSSLASSLSLLLPDPSPRSLFPLLLSPLLTLLQPHGPSHCSSSMSGQSCPRALAHVLCPLPRRLFLPRPAFTPSPPIGLNSDVISSMNPPLSIFF